MIHLLKAPHIYPDRKIHDWVLEYDPAWADGRGRITVGLDGQTCTLDLEPGAKAIGASFNRFGICTPWIDGNSVTVFFDDIEYTCGPGQPAAKGDSPTAVQRRQHQKEQLR